MMTPTITKKGIPSLRKRSVRKKALPLLTRLFHTKRPEMKNINAIKKPLIRGGSRLKTMLVFLSTIGAVGRI
jgi:hypothetical protein